VPTPQELSDRASALHAEALALLEGGVLDVLREGLGAIEVAGRDHLRRPRLEAREAEPGVAYRRL
jgi:hypothetical protein